VKLFSHLSFLLLSVVLVAQGQPLPDGPGRDVTVRVCGTCHDPQRVASLRLSREGWEQVIVDMTRRGARVTDDEFAAVLDYLSTHFLGEAAQPLNLNTATNIDLEAVVGLTRKEAAALREWLERSPCKALEELKKAPVDFRKIEERKDFLVCLPPLPKA
jgi:competence protein ComEA